MGVQEVKPMPTRINPKTGEIEFVADESVEREEYVPTTVADIEGLGMVRRAAAVGERQNRELAQQTEREYLERVTTGGGDVDDRPFIDPMGTFVDLTVKGPANALGAAVTDFADLGAMAVKALEEVPGLASGEGFDWGYVLDDRSDNWLNAPTRSRVENEWLKRNTKAGEIGATIQRGLTFIAATIFTGKAFTKIPAVAKAAQTPNKVGRAAQAVQGFRNWLSIDEFATTASKLRDVSKTLRAGTAPAKALDIVNDARHLTLEAKDISVAIARGLDKGGELKGMSAFLSDTAQATRAFTGAFRIGAKKPSTIVKTLGQAMAWDAFIAFNQAGEGDPFLDETLSDMAATSGLEWLEQLANNSGLVTYADDDAAIIKAKQTVENLFLGGISEGFFDFIRMARYAKNFRRADPLVKAQILEAFGENAQEIGGGIGMAMENLSRMNQKLLPSVGMRQAAQGPRWPVGLGPLDNLTAQVGDMRTLNDSVMRNIRDRELRGALGLEGQPGMLQGAEDAAQPMLQGAPTPGALPPGQVGGPLAQMAPDAAALPPGQAGGPLAQRQGGLVPMGVDQVDVRAMPPQERALTGAAAPDALEGAPTPARLPGGQVAGELPPGQVGGPLAPQELDPRIERAQVQDLGPTPRPPEPVPSRDLLDRTIGEEMDEAFARAALEGGPVPQLLGELPERIKAVLPRTRADAIEFMQKYKPSAQQGGVIRVTDSAMITPILNRGLAEGWVDVDPFTMLPRVNRRLAVDLDRGDLAIRSNRKIDEARELKRIQDELAPSQQTVDVNATAVDDVATPRLQAGVDEPTEPLKRANREAVESVQAKQEYDLAEAAKVARGREEPISASQLTDDEALREFLPDFDPADARYAPSVEKGTKGWVALDPEGGVIKETRTRKAAESAAAQYAEDFKQRMIQTARKKEADGTYDPFEISMVDTEYTDEVTGKVTLTAPQIRNLVSDMPELVEEFGDPALIKKQRTVEMGQARMKDVARRLRERLDSGEVAANTPQGRAMQAAIDKLDAQADSLLGESRVKTRAQKLADEVVSWLENGGLYCDA